MSDDISTMIREEFTKLVNEVLSQHDWAEVDHLGDYTIKIIQEIKLAELHLQHYVLNHKEKEKE